MANSRQSSSLRWLRWALLVAMLLVVGAVAGLFYLGRATRPRAAAQRPVSEPAPVAGTAAPRDAVVVTEGFEYEQQVEGKPVFRIRGDRMTTDRGGKVELEGVGLELYRSGEPFTMRSRRAVYDRETGEAQLEGDVELGGTHEWHVNAERLDLVEGGKAVVSGMGKGRVRFRRSDELSGNAGALRFTLDDERLELTDGVQARGREGDEQKKVEIEAKRLVWQRDSRAIEAEGEVELSWGKSRLHAARLDAVLRADEGSLESAEASGAVTGQLVPEKGSRVELAGERCRASFDPVDGSPTAIDLSGASAKSPARIEWSSAAGVRTVVAPELQLRLTGGTPATATARGGVELEERATGAGAVIRRVRSRELDATFDAAGELATANLDGNVRLEDGDIQVAGSEGRLTEGGKRMELTGKPARGTSPRGELTAPKLLFEREGGHLQAEGGVRARFEPEASPLPAGKAGAAREPVQIEAATGSFFEKTRRFVFAGEVQALQGSSLLFADRLEGDDATGTTTASGKVRTIWQDRAEPAGSGGEPAPGAKPPETIATAESLVYQRDEGVLRYAGAVHVRQAPRDIHASDMVVELGEDRRAESLHAKGAVVMSDTVSGQTVEGDEAEYDLKARSAVVTGEKVTIKDREGNILRGKRALFDLATGSAKLVSGDS